MYLSNIGFFWKNKKTQNFKERSSTQLFGPKIWAWPKIFIFLNNSMCKHKTHKKEKRKNDNNSF